MSTHHPSISLVRAIMIFAWLCNLDQSISVHIKLTQSSQGHPSNISGGDRHNEVGQSRVYHWIVRATAQRHAAGSMRYACTNTRNLRNSSTCHGRECIVGAKRMSLAVGAGGPYLNRSFIQQKFILVAYRAFSSWFQQPNQANLYCRVVSMPARSYHVQGRLPRFNRA